MKVKENRLRVFKAILKVYADERFCTLTSEYLEGLRYMIWKKHSNTNPTLGHQLFCLDHALNLDLSYNDLLATHEKYWSRFLEYMILKIKKKYGLPGPFPTMNRTQAIQEFIARGFVYETDAKIDKLGKYCVKANIANLWWPEHFDSHQDAIDIQTRFGISGLTGTTLPKERKS